jgi:hypothetical protein
METTKIEDNLIRSLTDLIDELQEKNKILTGQAKRWRIKYLKGVSEWSKMKQGLQKYFNEDQLKMIIGKKRVTWSNKTIKKGIITRAKAGNYFYNNVIRKMLPLPSKSTCLEKIKRIPFKPGILRFNCKILKAQYDSIPTAKRRMGLAFDEKAIVPGVQHDRTTNSYIGYTTLRPTAKILEKQEGIIANNALVVLAMGVDVRIKMPVGLQLCAQSSDPEEMEKFIFGCVIETENTAKVFIDFLAFDLGTSNNSLLNFLNVRVSKDNEKYFIVHPNDATRKLFLMPDNVHNLKNQCNGARNHDVIFGENLYSSFSLSSKRAKISDVKKIFNLQKEAKFKAAPELKQETINPDHFERMKERVVYKLFSTKVISAIQFQHESLQGETENATAFYLKVLNVCHSIVCSREAWSADKIQKYEDDIEFLVWMASEFLPNIKYEKAHLRSIAGMIMSIKSLVELSKIYMEKKIDVVPSRFLTNAVENLFSQITAIAKKATAIDFKNALRQTSLCQYEFDPISGSYEWDEKSESTQVNFLDIIESCNEENDQTKIQDDNDDYVRKITIYDRIEWQNLFANELEYNAFFVFIAKILPDILTKISCNSCRSLLIADDPEHSLHAQRLFDLQNILQPSQRLVPSQDLFNFCLKLEYGYQIIEIKNNSDIATMEKKFLQSVDELAMANEHCVMTTIRIAEQFIASNLHLDHLRHLPHRRSKQASKSLI